MPLWTCGAALFRGSHPSDPVLSESDGLDYAEELDHAEGLGHAEKPPACFLVVSVKVLSKGYGYGGPGVCLDDDQMEAEGIPSQSERGDTLHRRIPSHLTCPKRDNKI